MGLFTDSSQFICLNVPGTKEREGSGQLARPQLASRGYSAEYTVRGGDRGDGGEACMCFFFTKHPLPTSPLLQLSGCNRDGEMCPLNMEQNQ